MKEQELFKQLERVTHLGLILIIAVIILMGLVINNALTTTENYQTEGNPWCGFTEKTPIHVQEGKQLFLENCASCHNNDMKSDMTGPALYGVEERWAKYGGALYKWIQNAPKLVEEKNPKALSMKDWAATDMPVFEHLDSTKIAAILEYIKAKY